MRPFPASNPVRRERGLLIWEQSSSELVIYDEATDRAHTLNAAAATLWLSSDGRHTPAELAAILPESVPAEDRAAWVFLTLRKLERRGLLEWRETAPVSRRELGRAVRNATAAALLLPLVVSIVAPTAAQAGSPLGTGADCSEGTQCASGLCVGGKCL